MRILGLEPRHPHRLGVLGRANECQEKALGVNADESVQHALESFAVAGSRPITVTDAELDHFLDAVEEDDR